ncbi:hypothetical protein RJ639_017143, partial [Escallonia herrerae]
MENPEKVMGRLPSCRGVSFEIKPHLDPFAITSSPIDEQQPSKRIWLLWGSVSKVAASTTSSIMGRSISRTNEDDRTLADIDEGHDEEDHKPLAPLPLPPSIRKRQTTREQPSKVGKAKGSRLSVILLDQGLFKFYKRLFVVCMAVNITGLVLAATGNFPYARNKATLFSIGNILVLTFCRSEAFLHVVFWLAVNLLGWSWSLGGVHSGCGVSSVAWLIYALVLTLKDRENTSPEIIGVASPILALLCLSSLAAFPLVPHVHHNVFERTHRFAGWTALALLWAFILPTISYDPKTRSYHNQFQLSRHYSSHTGPLVDCEAYPSQGHCTFWSRLRNQVQRRSKSWFIGRISPSPLSEWHAFGIISDKKKEHMMLAGAVGDFTKSSVSQPPSHLWVRRVHFAGLPYLVNMYDRVLVVATGSGIYPCLGNVCFLWVAKGIEQNFGKEIEDWMSGHPKEKVIIHDTAVLGRPNVAQMSVGAAKNRGAEVVIVKSNPEGSRDVVDACKAA